MARPRLSAWMAAGIVAGCATAPPPPPPQPDVTVYIGQRDPAYEIPEHLRDQHRRDNERRMIEAVRFQQEGEALIRRMEKDPAFGGLIFRHQPEPHAIVMFTGDAEVRLRRYTTDPRFRAKSVELTLAELERMKDSMTAQLARLGLKCVSVDGDEEHNSVTVGAPPAELEKLRSAIASGAVKPPPKLRLVTGGCPEFR